MELKNIVTKIAVFEYEELSDIEKNLIDKAKEATETSYSPYSKFKVGAAALLDNNEIICGSNQENAAYPSGTCAERTTLFYANARYPKSAVLMLAIAAQSGDGFTEIPAAPCGACRQVILETETRFDTPMRILLYGRKYVYAVDSIKDLLPLYFGKSDLEK